MTLAQRTFAEIEVRRARRDDPDTSKQAARQSHGVAAEHVQRILNTMRECMAQFRCVDFTAHDIAHWSGLTNVQVSRRLKEMHFDGLIRPTGLTRLTPTRRAAQCWEICK